MIRGDDLCRCQHYRDAHAAEGRATCAAPTCRCFVFVFWKASVKPHATRPRKEDGAARAPRARHTFAASNVAAYEELLGRIAARRLRRAARTPTRADR